MSCNNNNNANTRKRTARTRSVQHTLDGAARKHGRGDLFVFFNFNFFPPQPLFSQCNDIFIMSRPRGYFKVRIYVLLVRNPLKWPADGVDVSSPRYVCMRVHVYDEHERVCVYAGGGGVCMCGTYVSTLRQRRGGPSGTHRVSGPEF